MVSTGRGTNQFNNALITGATAGIGYELSKLFAQDNYNLILVARDKQMLAKRKEEFESKYNGVMTTISSDLSFPGAAEELYESIKEKGLRVDVLVNNAGFGVLGTFTETDLPTDIKMVNLNITSLMVLTKLFLREMVERNSGIILNVASTAAFQPGPLMAVYYASKAFVVSFTQALSNEMKDSNVLVSTLCPGPTRTEFQQRANMGDVLLSKFNMMDAATCARIAYDGIRKGKTLIIPGVLNKLTVQSNRLFPRKLVIAVARRLQEKR
ncbi:MAG: SDR family NAD(P)-dependent oxidoreductase [Calditrichia bacterium]